MKEDYWPIFNRAVNLEWCTAKENVAHDLKLSKRQPNRGSGHGMSVLNEGVVTLMRQYAAKGMSIKSIADYFSVTPSTAGRAIKRISWKHVK